MRAPLGTAFVVTAIVWVSLAVIGLALLAGVVRAFRQAKQAQRRDWQPPGPIPVSEVRTAPLARVDPAHAPLPHANAAGATQEQRGKVGLFQTRQARHEKAMRPILLPGERFYCAAPCRLADVAVVIPLWGVRADPVAARRAKHGAAPGTLADSFPLDVNRATRFDFLVLTDRRMALCQIGAYLREVRWQVDLRTISNVVPYQRRPNPWRGHWRKMGAFTVNFADGTALDLELKERMGRWPELEQLDHVLRLIGGQ